MRKGTKILVTASVFAVAMNANACMYGPPPEGYEGIRLTATPVVEQQVQTQIPVEPAQWSLVTLGRYAVIRVLSVTNVENMPDGQSGDVVCGIEVLSAYNVEESLNTISELLIPAKESSLFSEGDVLFVELGRMVHRDGEDTYRIAEGESGAVFTPYEGNRLVVTQRFMGNVSYELLECYNGEIRGYQWAMEKGEEYYMPFDFRPFEEGMTTEETALFFEDLKKAKADYDVVLEELRNEMMGGAENE